MKSRSGVSIKTGARLGRWTVESWLGKGGNGTVWRAADAAGSVGALKTLLNTESARANHRFADEVEAMRACQDIAGVLPLLDFHIPTAPSQGDPAWFVAVLAEPLDKIKEGFNLRGAVEICLSLSRTLAAMHARGYSHRDIKPNNIFRIDKNWFLGDFGLTDFPDKAAITKEGEKLGPAYYIAPEMLNSAASSDGRKADTYSLGKLLWKLATGQDYPLPGMHSREHAMMRIKASPGENTATLNALLEGMTQVDADKRPPMEEVARELEAWCAPSPQATRPTDLAPFKKRVEALTAPHSENIRRCAGIQVLVDQGRNQAFAEFSPTIDIIKTELEQAHIGAVSIQGASSGLAEFYAAITNDVKAADSQITWFQYSVTAKIDGGEFRGQLKSGINLGIRQLKDETAGVLDRFVPAIAATGHIVTLDHRFGGAWRSSSELVWGDQDTFTLQQPLQSQILSRFQFGLTEKLASAIEALLNGMEFLRKPKEKLKHFTVKIQDKSFDLFVSEQRHLDGITRARARSELVSSSDADYVQQVLSAWAAGESAVLTEQVLQETLNRAVESYAGMKA